MSELRTSERKFLLIALFVIVLTLFGMTAVTFNEQQTVLLYDDEDSIAQFKSNETQSTDEVGTWNNMTFNKVDELQRKDYFEIIDNESIRCDFSGVVKFSGKVTVINNATSLETQKIALRIVANNIENTYTQLSSNTQRVKQAYNTISIVGVARVEKGDLLNLQYNINDNDLIIQGDDDFEEPVSVSLSIHRIGE